MFKRLRRLLKLLNRIEKVLDAREVPSSTINNELKFNILAIRKVECPGIRIHISILINNIEEKRYIDIDEYDMLSLDKINKKVTELIKNMIAESIFYNTETIKELNKILKGI